MAKCEGCGFLCLRRDDGEFVEANSNYRKDSGDPGHPQAGHMPTCFVMAFDLRGEFEQEFKKQRSIAQCLGHVLNHERTCERFTPWQQGFTPKEHREMLFDLERKKLELQEKEGERRWHERRDRFQLVSTLAGAVVGSLLTAALGGVVAWWVSARGDTKPPAPSPPDRAAPMMPPAKP